MNIGKKIFSKFYLIVFFLLVLILLFYLLINKFQKNKETAFQPIMINLLTSVHPNLFWEFRPVKQKIFVKPGEVTTVEYMVENLGNKETTGVATFAYFPNQFGNYISKINCFCYDARTLKPKEKDTIIEKKISSKIIWIFNNISFHDFYFYFDRQNRIKF